ncbi:VWA domain-containing protein [Paenibacillus alkaliterrae]|uniref:VWA domain-containing protein n=1 Tax=Paenibacillus alkaliterrae TaxID=320909 RepID=UPI001F1B8B62|nr:VWA domain-containing protein [Paenibacillus alkaliterrae]MCF2941662.1 VWA domain-containing protein [Paenibacillus alkaliterrae]
MSIELRKKAEEKLIDLSKKATISLTKKGLTDVRARVGLAVDISGSMVQLFRSGVVQNTCERTLGLAMNFDDNEAADVFLFGIKDYGIGEIQKSNFFDFVDREITKKYKLEAGTQYAGVLRRIVDFYFPGAVSEKKSGGLFGFGGKKELQLDTAKFQKQEPVYILFVTDGNCTDDRETEDIIRKASKLGIFFQFVGIGNESFNFLRKLDDLQGRFIDNAAFFSVKNLAQTSDDDLYDKLLHEFPSWINEARDKNLVR